MGNDSLGTWKCLEEMGSRGDALKDIPPTWSYAHIPNPEMQWWCRCGGIWFKDVQEHPSTDMLGRQH